MRAPWTGLLLLLAMAAAGQMHAQTAAPELAPLAVVPLDAHMAAEDAPHLSGALEVSAGRAVIMSSGTIVAGRKTAEVLLPRRGTLRVCGGTTARLAADRSQPGAPSLLLALDHGAIEASLATVSSADVVMTPDFRILVAGPGAAEVRIRLGEHGDTCVDNAGKGAPYVLVSSVFEDGAYRVQPGQRVMFEHGSLRTVVDDEKEPCGCPPEAPKGNEFPLAASQGLGVNTAPVVPDAGQPAGVTLAAHGEPVPEAAKPVEAPKPATPSSEKAGFWGGVGRFFHRLFGGKS